jgi:trypsin
MSRKTQTLAAFSALARFRRPTISSALDMKTSFYVAFVASLLRSGHAQQQQPETVTIYNATSHIVGGKTAAKGAYPYYAIPNGNFLCGATLIHPDILISAAHCNGRSSNFLPSSANARGGGVYIGSNKVDGSDAKDTINVKLVRVHPEFSMETLHNDVVLLKLATPSSAPIAPWNADPLLPAAGATVTAIGFGTTQDGGSISNTLQEVNLEMVDWNTCQKAYGANLDRQSMICAAGNGKDSCQGDSGGPLLYNGVVVGMVSFGYGCAVQTYPGVYSSTASAREFIQRGICELSDTPPEGCADVLTASGQETVPGQWPICNVCSQRGVLRRTAGTVLRRISRSGRCRETCASVGLLAWKLFGWECGKCQ